MIEFNFTTDGIADIDDRERECNNLARVVETLGEGATEIFINRVTINAKFHGASMHAEEDGKKPMEIEMVFTNGTSVHTEMKSSDRITIDRIDNSLFISIYE